MGADLYVYNVLGDRVAYFRDGYNDGNLLWLVNKSWWLDIAPLKRSSTRIKRLKAIAEDVEHRADWIEAAFKEEWGTEYLRKLRELKDWLDVAEAALQHGGRVEWSL